jgi:SAM-dependent MidA family methyltransferase
MELALYHPEFGYYARAVNPVGKGGDYITAPTLSSAFSFAIAGLVRQFMSRVEGAVTSIVDIGCGDGALIRDVARQVGGNARFFGIDRSLDRTTGQPGHPITFLTSIDQLPRDGVHFFFSNELYDAFPFARLVRRDEHLHELWVTERDGVLGWIEHEAPGPYEDYFAARDVELAAGQFADISLEWEAFHDELAAFLQRGLIVTIDYGFPQAKLFDRRIRRFGTAAAYSGQRVTRDLFANPGEQDLTAHINFTDLERAGERHGAITLFFGSLARFLLSLGITDHPLFTPVLDASTTGRLDDSIALLDERENARRLVLPDGIGEDLRVLVQAKGMAPEGWSFQRSLFP